MSNIKNEVLVAFKKEFGDLKEKFEAIDLLEQKEGMDYNYQFLEVDSERKNVISNPGVYMFLGNDHVYRVGKSSRNCINRVKEHLDNWTSADGHCIWDIDKYGDKSILLLNVKDRSDAHWVLSLEAFFESKFKPLIKAKRVG